jgi:hypothetical protein
MPNDVTRDNPSGVLIGRSRPIRQPQPGGPGRPNSLGVSQESYPQKTRRLRVEQQRRARIRPTTDSIVEERSADEE